VEVSLVVDEALEEDSVVVTVDSEVDAAEAVNFGVEAVEAVDSVEMATVAVDSVEAMGSAQ
jgi:hypothetical protein